MILAFEQLLARTRLLEKSDRWKRRQIAPWQEADPILAAAGEAGSRASARVHPRAAASELHGDDACRT